MGSQGIFGRRRRGRGNKKGGRARIRLLSKKDNREWVLTNRIDGVYIHHHLITINSENRTSNVVE